MKRLPPLSYLRKRLRYDADSGLLFWIEQPGFPKQWNIRYAGRPAGSQDKNGYTQVRLDGSMYFGHRLAWALYHGRDPYPFEIDHKDGGHADNRIFNLRKATTAQNRQNMRARGGYAKGVYRNCRGKFLAQIKKDGTHHYLGTFDTEIEAAQAYAEKSRELFGEWSLAESRA